MITILVVLSGALSCSQDGTPGTPGTSGPQPSAHGEQAVIPDTRSAEESLRDSTHSVSAIATDVRLSPVAMVQSEKFMCVCGCGMALAECSCGKDPGGITMKKKLQALVDEGLSPSAIADAMVAAYGGSVLR